VFLKGFDRVIFSITTVLNASVNAKSIERMKYLQVNTKCTYWTRRCTTFY